MKIFIHCTHGTAVIVLLLYFTFITCFLTSYSNNLSFDNTTIAFNNSDDDEIENVQATWQGFDVLGRGIVIGIIDSGLDFELDHFLTMAGRTRVLAYWDQDSTRINPRFAHRDYGVVLYEKDINDIIDGLIDDPVRADTKGHGTSVASIAASSNIKHSGVAPNSMLVMVHLPDTFNLEKYILDGIEFIHELAADKNIPFVINVSVGCQSGTHDGLGDYEYELDNYLKLYSNQGIRGIVVAAGNKCYDENIPGAYLDRRNKIHARNKGTNSFTIDIDASSRDTTDYIYIACWYDYDSTIFENYDYSIQITTPSSKRYGPVGSGEVLNQRDYYTKDGYIEITNYGMCTNRHSPSKLIEIKIMDKKSPLDTNWIHMKPGKWIITMIDSSFEENSWWDAYVVQTRPNNKKDIVKAIRDSSYDAKYSIGNGGNAHDVITVGSYNSMNSWWGIDTIYRDSIKYYDFSDAYPLYERSHFSSLGPPRGNRYEKPDVYAPGAMIISAWSRFYGWEEWGLNMYVMPDRRHILGQGTSFAAPYVTGCLALMVEANLKDTIHTDTLNYKQLKEILITTSKPSEADSSINIISVYDAVKCVFDRECLKSADAQECNTR